MVVKSRNELGMCVGIKWGVVYAMPEGDGMFNIDDLLINY